MGADAAFTAYGEGEHPSFGRVSLFKAAGVDFHFSTSLDVALSQSVRRLHLACSVLVRPSVVACQADCGQDQATAYYPFYPCTLLEHFRQRVALGRELQEHQIAHVGVGLVSLVKHAERLNVPIRIQWDRIYLSPRGHIKIYFLDAGLEEGPCSQFYSRERSAELLESVGLLLTKLSRTYEGRSPAQLRKSFRGLLLSLVRRQVGAEQACLRLADIASPSSEVDISPDQDGEEAGVLFQTIHTVNA